MKISSNNIDYKDMELFNIALQTSENAYAPYSHFRVGAALLTETGEVITGVNVENRSYGLTNCAERTAVYSAIAKGTKKFVKLAIATPDANYPVPPCGACRQVISEFMDKDALIIFGSSKENIKIIKLEQLYPMDSLHELGKHITK
ncbi:MAG: cytidine deaminase [Treponema sp.]